LLGLIPGNQDSWWTVLADSSVEPVAAKFLAAVRSYGLPAIWAALDEPGFPPDQAIRWARTFPPGSSALGLPTPADRGTASWVLEAAACGDDKLFAGLADRDPTSRLMSVELIADRAMDDPRAIPALLNLLEHDPSHDVRLMAAWCLTPLAGQPRIYQALLAAAAQDEDLEVRWQARYAITLTRRERPTAK
jgi:hypothetical protein